MSVVKLTRVTRGITFGARHENTGELLYKYEDCKDTWVPSIDIETGSMRTGLTDEDAVKLEKKLSMPAGTLAADSPYWFTYAIAIPGEGITINTKNPLGELRYKVLSADPRIATSKADEAINANAEYLMTSDEEIAQVSNNARDIKIKAYTELGKLSRVGVEDMLFLYGINGSDTTPEANNDRLGKLVDTNPKKFLELTQDEEGKDKVFILRCIKQGIIVKVGNGIGTDLPLRYGSTELGIGLDQAISFLKDNDNQGVFRAIKAEVKKVK